MNKNKRSFLRWLLVPMLVAGIGSVHAQEVVDLNLKKAITYALEANQNARKARLDVENSEYKIDEVKSTALPQITGNAALTNNPLLQQSALPNIFGPNPNPDETILVSFGQKWNAQAGISLTQNIFDKSVLTGLNAARTTREFYKLSAQVTEDQVIELVATNYYQLLVQRQHIGALDSTIKNTQKVLAILQNQYKNGLAKKIDVDRMTVNLSNLNSQRLQLTNGVTLLENGLKFYMGMPIQTPIRVPEEDINSIQPQAIASSELIRVEDHLEYKLLERQQDLLSYQKDAYKAEYYPSLSLSSNYSFQGMGNQMPVFKGKDQGVNWVNAASVSLNLRIPI
jgi:outer membrane protein